MNEVISTEACLRYWRNMLADEDMVGLPSAESPVRTSAAAIAQGKLDPQSTRSLQAAWSSHLKQVSSDRMATDESEFEATSVPVLIFDKGLSRRHEHGVASGARPSSQKAYYTFHIPAHLSPDGSLSFMPASLPWIGRDFLLPNEDGDDDVPIVGDIAVLDGWLDRHPLEAAPWPEVMRWCAELWTHVTGNQTPSGFVALEDVRIDIARKTKNAGRNLIRLYDALLAESRMPDLLQRMCTGWRDAVVAGDALRRAQLAAPRGTMSPAYGLADSQADAIAAFSKLARGEVLAVNGPPGTGKTTLLQSIIATEVVGRALEGGDPAVIVGTSTNNLAVLNINRSLNEILQENAAGTPHSWARRWVPEAETYGLYLPSSEDQAKEAAEKGFASALFRNRAYSGFTEREKDPDYVDRARARWLASYEATFGEAPETLQAGLERLRADLAGISRHLETIQASFIRAAEIEAWWSGNAGGSDAQAVGTAIAAGEHARTMADAEALEAQAAHDGVLETVREEQRRNEETVSACQSLLRTLAATKAGMAAATAPHGVIEFLAGFIPPLADFAARRRFARLCAIVARHPDLADLFAREIRSNAPTGWLERADSLLRDADDELARLTGEKAGAEAQRAAQVQRTEAELRKALARQQDASRYLEAMRSKAEELSASRAQLRSILDALKGDAVAAFRLKPSSLPDLPAESLPVLSLDQVLDMTWRHKAFELAMRYWEGRWILEAEGIRDGEVNTKRGRNGVEAQFRRWCMLTPCLVMTLHSLPKHFRYTVKAKNDWLSNFMFEFIDLLIMDESGQVGPHIGAASFSLAKRAVVVGDIYQIEPIATVSRSADFANAKRYGLESFWRDGEPAAPHIVSKPRAGGPQGSVMRLAQHATSACSQDTEDERGIFLSEHRRCRAQVIAYCNRLVYKGRLQALSPPRPKEPPLPPLAWAHVRGLARKHGGSNSNEREAAAIVDWLASNAQGWRDHYGKSLKDIVAVITPFRPQANLIRKGLAKAGSDFGALTVGTVHSLQGAEKPIVVFSPTYDADTLTGSMFFDLNPNMMNVAVSRAKDSFVVIGDMRLFRRKDRTPSSLLGTMLFADEANELPDVEGNYRFTNELLARAERISSLDRHREVLRQSLTNAATGQTILIASPWISLKAVETDRLPDLVQRAVQQGGRVMVVVDGELAFKTPAHRAGEALERVAAAGASVFLASSMHNKTLIVGRSEIVEGSFNWLSANRQPNDAYIRHETSWRIRGDGIGPVIEAALKEFAALGVRGDAQAPRPLP
ncbi:AAA domain-containing protein [Shinella sp. BYT-45]|uniref:AAA domain-containing protein n=1 Tax=Shinella sp. BYT-45 TaxID=3377377 RepID=UPI00397EF403